MHLECAQRVRVGRRDEDDGWHAVGTDGAHYAETIELRHLDVEQHDIGCVTSDRGHGVPPVAALADHLDIRLIGQQLAQAPPSERLIVDDQQPKRLACLRGTAAGVHAWNGSSISTMNPFAGDVVTTMRWFTPYR